MTHVDINRLKGNYAESVAASWLSRQCLVRQVSAGTDIGVDLYCESIIEGVPFLHFWGEVKAINKDNMAVNGLTATAWYRFDKKHLRYWDRQPVPVYAFLVPVEAWPPAEPKQIYGIRITNEIVRNGIPDAETVQYKTSDTFAAHHLDGDLKSFLTKTVPSDASALLMKRGIIAPIPSPDTSIETHFPFLMSIPYLDLILNTIRDAAVIGLLDTVIFEGEAPGFKKERKKFESLASLFESEMHELGISALVRSAHLDGRVSDAKAIVLRAIQRVENDVNIEESAKDETVGKLKQLLPELE